MPRAIRIAGRAALVVGLLLAARRLGATWGARGDEPVAPLPGDVLVPAPEVVATRAVSIAAPPEAVWPWVVQLGQGRGGFYSYTALENLVGCDIHNAARIEPRWQTLDVGDEVRLHPEVALRVARVDPGAALVLQGAVPVGEKPAPYDFTWAFVLRPTADGGTRLVVRERYGYARRWAALVVQPVQLVSLVMSVRMLRGIKDRAERGVGAVPDGA
ncbi:SRPBCC family protein [Oerskovia flava]|uniref:SRPBCC family protein n=1 Tax=Oerskovia flava TaxID=2986422 RepID=UPI0022404CB3|nr:SRPBCC family protein [Oerskovia sp. JB1-3-2]